MGRYLGLIILSLCVVAVVSTSVEISNDAVSVGIQINSNSLTEVYSTKQNNNINKVLTYTGPLFTGSDFDGAYVVWNSVTQVNDTSAVVKGSLMYFQDSNFMGGDYANYNLTTADANICMGMCLKDSNCKSWTYVKPGYQGPTAQCWLKNGASTNKLDDCCASGYTSYPQVVRTITLLSDAVFGDLNAIYVSHEFLTPFFISLGSVDDWYTFASYPVDFAYSPHIKQQPADLTPHWEFKSPVVMFQSQNVFAALVPDVDQLTSDNIKNFPPNMDMINDGETAATFSYTITPTTLTFHSLYSRDTGVFMNWTASAPFSANYYLFLSNDAVPLHGYELVTPVLWNLFGHPRLQASPQMQTSQFNKSLTGFVEWRYDTWHRFAQQVYFQFPCGSETCGSLSSYLQEGNEGYGTNQDGWFNSWFQQLRTAYGMYIAAQRAEDTELAQQAIQVLYLALNAPQYNATAHWGPFPSIFWLGTDNSINWVVDAGGSGLCRNLPNPPADCRDYYHSFDLSWTGYWLLQWHKLVNDSRIMPMVQGYADFLLQVQQEDGGIPSWFELDTLTPAPEFLLINAEVAGSALFLAELYTVTNNKALLVAAERAAEYLEVNIIATRKWFDFETFYSCSLKPLGFYDGITSQYPENNLAKLQATMLYYKLYNVTQNSTYLETGCNVLDYTLLTQQVWSHVLLSPNLLGGFTTQNTDSEWSDARQGYAAATLLDYYLTTRRLEYLERGVAALRSSFAVAPYENWAHTGGSQGDEQGALTGIHWCQGSGMTSIEMHADWLQDAYVNVQYMHAVGVNGCSLSNLSLTSVLQVDIVSTYQWPAGIVLSIEGLNMTTQVQVNGYVVGNAVPSSTSPFTTVDVPNNIINAR